MCCALITRSSIRTCASQPRKHPRTKSAHWITIHASASFHIVEFERSMRFGNSLLQTTHPASTILDQIVTSQNNVWASSIIRTLLCFEDRLTSFSAQSLVIMKQRFASIESCFLRCYSEQTVSQLVHIQL